MKTYILFVFAAHDNQDRFIKILSEEVVGASDTCEVKYYYGPESAIITFKTFAEFEYIKSYIDLVLGTSGIVFFLLPYDPNNISFFLNKEIETHLFGYDNLSESGEKTKYEQIQEQKLIFNEMMDIPTNFIEELMASSDVDDDDEDDEDDDFITSLKEKTYDPTLDEILDKINLCGMPSLTKKELSLLKNYSN